MNQILHFKPLQFFIVLDELKYDQITNAKITVKNTANGEIYGLQYSQQLEKYISVKNQRLVRIPLALKRKIWDSHPKNRTSIREYFNFRFSL